jgi:hypothetical protein
MYAPLPRQALFAIILPSCAGDAFSLTDPYSLFKDKENQRPELPTRSAQKRLSEKLSDIKKGPAAPFFIQRRILIKRGF